MTYGDILDALRYESARLLMGNMDDEKVTKLIDELTRQGVYFDEFLDVLERPYYRPDFLKALTASLARLGIEMPKNQDQAVWVLLTQSIFVMSSDKCDAAYAMSRLMADVYWNYDFSKLTKNYVGDSHGIEHLIGLYWDYDDLCCHYAPNSPPESDDKEYEAQLRDNARKWLAKYATQVP